MAALKTTLGARRGDARALARSARLIVSVLMALTALWAPVGAWAQARGGAGPGAGAGGSAGPAMGTGLGGFRPENGGAGIGGLGAGTARPLSIPQASQTSQTTPTPSNTAATHSDPNPASTNATRQSLDPGSSDGAQSMARPQALSASHAADLRSPEREQRVQAVDQLLRSYPGLLERDPQGEAVLSGEIMVLLPEKTRLPSALLARGFSVLRQTEVLGRSMVVLRVPASLTLQAAIELAEQLLPGAEVDFNHLHLGSGVAAGVAGGLGKPGLLQAASASPSAADTAPALRIGLIDEALQAGPELRDVPITSRACAGAPPPEGHGTAVATVLRRAARGLGRRIRLHAADMSCGHGSVDAIAGALSWMDAELIPVVNISMVGPHNRVLAAVVASFLGKGHLLVAAVGNDGPAAPPLYPAAYPGVVGVTAVDERGQVLIEAGRGEHVAFAALGIADIDTGTGHRRHWRGTSFAAPIVSAALAARLPAPDLRSAAEAVTSLARSACDLGEPGRDKIYGYGLVGDLPKPTLAVDH